MYELVYVGYLGTGCPQKSLLKTAHYPTTQSAERLGKTAEKASQRRSANQSACLASGEGKAAQKAS
jgi:hypothetical protein